MSDEHRTARSEGDSDPQETGEWLDSLEYVLAQHGVGRATYLFERLRDRLGETRRPGRPIGQHSVRQHDSSLSTAALHR